MTEEAKEVMKACTILKNICNIIDELNLFLCMNEHKWMQDGPMSNRRILADLELKAHFDATGAKRILERIIQTEAGRGEKISQEAKKFIERLSRLETKTERFSQTKTEGDKDSIQTI